jgi:hypothetical protein
MPTTNNALLIVAVLLAIVAVGAYVLGHRRHEEPNGVLGNAAAAVSDKIDQAVDQSRADADKNAADSHIDAAKENLGLKPASQ